MTGSVSPVITESPRLEVEVRPIVRRTIGPAIVDVRRAVATATTVARRDAVAVGGVAAERILLAPTRPWPTWRRRLGLPGAGATPAQSYFYIPMKGAPVSST
jgi:hypothetical protein